MHGTPEYDEFLTCLNPDCIFKEAKPDRGYGMLGGGIGPYTYCSNCGTLLTKSQDEALFDSHEANPVEIKDERPSDNQDGGTDGQQ